MFFESLAYLCPQDAWRENEKRFICGFICIEHQFTCLSNFVLIGWACGRSMKGPEITIYDYFWPRSLGPKTDWASINLSVAHLCQTTCVTDHIPTLSTLINNFVNSITEDTRNCIKNAGRNIYGERYNLLYYWCFFRSIPLISMESSKEVLFSYLGKILRYLWMTRVENNCIIKFLRSKKRHRINTLKKVY